VTGKVLKVLKVLTFFGAAQLLVRRAVDLLEEEDMQRRRGVWGSLPPATEPTTEAEP